MYVQCTKTQLVHVWGCKKTLWCWHNVNVDEEDHYWQWEVDNIAAAVVFKLDGGGRGDIEGEFCMSEA